MINECKNPREFFIIDAGAVMTEPNSFASVYRLLTLHEFEMARKKHPDFYFSFRVVESFAYERQAATIEKLRSALEICAMPYEPDVTFTSPDTINDLEERQHAARKALEETEERG